MFKVIKSVIYTILPQKTINYCLKIRAQIKYKNLKIEKGVLIPLNTKLGQNIYLYQNVKMNNVQIGDFSYIAKNTILNSVIIGKFCSIGSNVQMGLGIHPSKIFVSTCPVFYSTKKQLGITWSDRNYFKETDLIFVGNDVWIGNNVIVKDGIKIGDGAIIGANAVVVKDVQPYSIVGGVPAKHIRFRFSEKQIKKLLELQWWNKDSNWLKQNFKLFHNINTFLESLK